MAISEYLERLEEHDVPPDVIDGIKAELDSSGLRKKISELEARWKEEAEPAIDYRSKHETLPKRKEALERVGIKYDDVPLYGRKTLDAIPADKLDNLEYLAEFVSQEGFEAAQPSEGKQEGAESGAAQIVNQGLSAGTSTGAAVDRDALINAAQSQEELDEVLQQHPHPAASRG